MDKELKAKWVEALRSGRYAQAHRTLCENKEAFCCLGVLLSVSDRGEWNGSMYEFEDDYGSQDCFDGDLGTKGCRMFGLRPDAHTKLISMNDDEGADFCQIADFIESVLR